MPARNGARDPVDGNHRTRSAAQLPDARDLDQKTLRSGARACRMWEASRWEPWGHERACTQRRCPARGALVPITGTM